MRKRKIVNIILLLIIIAAAAAAIALIFSNGNDNEKTFHSEAVKLSEAASPDDIDTALLCSGDYMAAEDDMKSYVYDYLTNLEEFEKLTKDSVILDILSIENIRSDGPVFSKSREYLNDKKKQISEKADEISAMSSEESIAKQLEYDGVSDNVKNLYIEEMTGTIGEKLFLTEDELDQKKDSMCSEIDEFLSVIGFLEANADSWSAEVDKIVFSDSKLLERYEELTSAIGKGGVL